MCVVHILLAGCVWCAHKLPALTEVLLPKQVYLTTPGGGQQQLEQLKANTSFAAAFTAPALHQQAEELWQQLGRAGPPLFRKVRTRSSLQDCEEEVRAWAA